jgi:hypothetical protein
MADLGDQPPTPDQSAQGRQIIYALEALPPATNQKAIWHALMCTAAPRIKLNLGVTHDHIAKLVENDWRHVIGDRDPNKLAIDTNGFGKRGASPLHPERAGKERRITQGKTTTTNHTSGQHDPPERVHTVVDDKGESNIHFHGTVNTVNVDSGSGQQNVTDNGKVGGLGMPMGMPMEYGPPGGPQEGAHHGESGQMTAYGG